MVRYIELLFRFRVRFVVLLLILPALAGGVTMLLFPSYKAAAELWVDDPTYFGGTSPSGWSIYLTPAQNEADDLTQLVSTRAFQIDLYNQMAQQVPDPAERGGAVGGAKVTIVATGTHMIEMTATCKVKAMCIVLVNTSVDVLREEQIKDEQANATAGAAFLTAQLQQAKAALSVSQDSLRAYIATHPGARTDVDPSQITDAQLARLAADVQQKQAQVNDLQNHVDQSTSSASASAALISAGPRIIDPPVITRGFPIGDGSGLKKAAAAAGGVLAVGLVYLFLLGWVDKTLRDPRDIEHRFKVPVVTTIPELLPSERF